MRAFGILLDNTVRLRGPTIPDGRQARANPPAVRLLDEAMREAFNQACMIGELEAAADLLALMEKWSARRSYADEQTKRTDRLYLRRMLCELERRHIMRGTHAPTASL
jgi:hypothetical protein